MAKKEKKRTYVKPQIQVVEWYFNEEVCANNFNNASGCPVVGGDEGGTTHIDHRESFTQGSIEWNKPWRP